MNTMPTCQICHTGQLLSRRMYRLSGPAVVIGYIFLIPAIFGILLGILFFVGSCGAAATTTTDSPDVVERTRTKLEQAGIPESMILTVLDGKSVPERERLGLSGDQRKALLDGTVEILAPKMVKGAGAVLAGGFSFFLILVSFTGGLLGWILTMKKRVLKCTSCGATVAAS